MASTAPGEWLPATQPAEAALPPASSSSGATASEAALPNAPGFVPAAAPQGTNAGPSDNSGAKPSKRILGILPNYRSVAVGAHLPPQTVKEKFTTATQDTFDPGAFALAFIVAGYDYGTTQTPEFGTGGVGYSRYLWHSFADQSIENYSVEFIVPALTHEDTRYYTLGKGGFKKRTIYSLTRILITRSDAGHETFNFSEVGGAGLAAAVSNFYYPRPERTAGQTLQKYGTSLGIDAASYFVREFDTEIARLFTRGHTAVQP